MYRLVNLPHNTNLRRIVHNEALNSRLSYLIITYNMTDLPHAHIRFIVVFFSFTIKLKPEMNFFNLNLYNSN